MQLTTVIASLFAIGANAATISARQDLVLFTYNIVSTPVCTAAAFQNLQNFTQSQLPADGCFVFSSPVKTFLLAETPQNGNCQVILHPDAACAQGTYTLTSLHCGNAPTSDGFNSLSVANCL
ncbi:hypothetical protein B0T19DRAFT_439388 [Cercophora scortea]|uniref:Uncharacterized protein n=1 Tax=Cercophora scortea TaxID=314031 RepID=A0AAE0IWK3_9PEZI|nr:hypothetical protein B0T19DRAFT_439388 [Cercophora scortea]